jgi:chromosomal replication initiator protein
VTFESIFSLPNSIPSELMETLKETGSNNEKMNSGVGSLESSAKAKNSGFGSKDKRSRLFFGRENSLLKLLLQENLAGWDKSFFPLFFYGPSGCGKSAIAELFARDLSESFSEESIDAGSPEELPLSFTPRETPREGVFHRNASDFFRDFIEAVDLDELENFRGIYKKSKVVILDNIDELIEKKSVHGELIHLLDRCPLVILTSVIHPSEFNAFPGQVNSRLLSGLCIPVENPETTVKTILIENEVSLLNGTIEREAALWLAENACPNIPLLKQQVSKLRIHLNLQKPVTLSALKKIFNKKVVANVTLPLICRIVAKNQRLKSSDMKSQSRKRSIVLARGVAVYIARENYRFKYDEIGKFFGNRDHTTVMHAHRRFKLQIVTDLELKNCLEEIEKQIELEGRR